MRPSERKDRVLADLLVIGISELATPEGATAKVGSDTGRLRLVEDAAVASRDGTIVFVGTSDEARRVVELTEGGRTIPADGCTVLPGFVDAHTHLPFAGWRETEFDERLRGATYSEIAARGGGILSTVRETRHASTDELAHAVRERLDAMVRLGTTTVEAKSGYGLDPETERRQLVALREASRDHPIDVVPTFLGAHTVPAELRHDRDAYVRSVVDTMIPSVARDGLAEFADVFVDEHAFRVSEARTILRAASDAGLRPRVHADQLADDGAAALAADVGAASADHLEFASDPGLEAMARAGTVGVILPSATLFLMMDRRPPGRRLVDAGVAVALATDFNPGSCPCESMSTALWLGCLTAGLTVDEAITAATLNAASSLGRAGRTGSIEAGKRADFVIHDVPSRYHLVYRFGVDRIRAVVAGGVVAFDRWPRGARSSR